MQIQLVGAEVANVIDAEEDEVRLNRNEVATITTEQWNAMSDNKKALFLAYSDPDNDEVQIMSIDNVDGMEVIELPDNQTNGFVVKVSATDVDYGKGQGFLLLEEGEGDATDQGATGSVLFRVDATGGIGTSGGIHVATGLRKHNGGTVSVWIDPAVDVLPLVIHNPTVAESATWTQPYMQITDVRNANKMIFRVHNGGNIESGFNMMARSGEATQAMIGEIFGLAGLGLGASSDTLVVRVAAGIIGVFNAMEFTEMAAPAAPAANKFRIYAKDNGSGKTQVVVKFNTGAEVVLATQP